MAWRMERGRTRAICARERIPAHGLLGYGELFSDFHVSFTMGAPACCDNDADDVQPTANRCLVAHGDGPGFNVGAAPHFGIAPAGHRSGSQPLEVRNSEPTYKLP